MCEADGFWKSSKGENPPPVCEPGNGCTFIGFVTDGKETGHETVSRALAAVGRNVTSALGS